MTAPQLSRLMRAKRADMFVFKLFIYFLLVGKGAGKMTLFEVGVNLALKGKT